MTNTHSTVDIHRRSLLLGAGAAAALPLAIWAAPRRAEHSDLMPAFWRVYDATRHVTTESRTKRLAADFFAPQQAFYRRAGMPVPATPDLVRWLAVLDRIAPAVRSLHSRFADEY